jgi:hypothetical protein
VSPRGTWTSDAIPIVVIPPQAAVGQIAQHPIPHRSPRPSLGPKPVLVLEEVGDILGFLSDVGTNVLAVVVDVDKLLEGSTGTISLISLAKESSDSLLT